jgi:hypothetical protein
MQITLNVKKVVKSPTKTGLEIFSELYTSAAYRPLIGNQPGGAATQELVKTIGKWALVTSAPVLIHKIATHMSDERHAEKTLQRNHRNLDRLEQNNKAIPEEIRAKVINHTMNPTPSGSKPGLLGNLFGWGKK